MRVLKSKLLVALSLLSLPCAMAADRKHKQPMSRHAKGEFVAYAYTSKNLTKEGKPPVAGKTIAADPRLLPLGSRVRISGAGPYSGEYRVGDVGPAIKGNKVDIFVQTRGEAIQFGRRSILLTVLEIPQKSAEPVATRARKAEPRPAKRCDGCGSEDMIAIDEARGSSTSPVRSASAPRGTGTDPGQSDSREGRSLEALSRMPAF